MASLSLETSRQWTDIFGTCMERGFERGVVELVAPLSAASRARATLDCCGGGVGTVARASEHVGKVVANSGEGLSEGAWRVLPSDAGVALVAGARRDALSAPPGSQRCANCIADGIAVGIAGADFAGVATASSH